MYVRFSNFEALQSVKYFSIGGETSRFKVANHSNNFDHRHHVAQIPVSATSHSKSVHVLVRGGVARLHGVVEHQIRCAGRLGVEQRRLAVAVGALPLSARAADLRGFETLARWTRYG